MSFDIDNIVLEPIASEQTSVPLEQRYYDPNMQYLKTAGKDNMALTFDIDKIISQYSIDRSKILRLSLPTALFTRRRGPQQQVPTMWEMGGMNRSGYSRPSWCTIVGSPSGGKVSRHEVCQVRYPTSDRVMHPSGRHALVAIQPETMFIMAQKTTTSLVALIYKIDNVVDWSPEFKHTMPIKDRFGERFYMAMNCSLVGIRQIVADKVVGWADNKRLNNEELLGVPKLFRLAQEKLAIPAIAPCNVEMFWDAAANSADRNQHEVQSDGTLINSVVPNAEDFLSEVILSIGEYRKLLGSSDLSIKAHPIPASVHYERLDDNMINISVEVPSVLSEYSHFSISTTLRDILPNSLLSEPNLTRWCTNFSELYASLPTDQVAVHNIFTFC